MNRCACHSTSCGQHTRVGNGNPDSRYEQLLYVPHVTCIHSDFKHVDPLLTAEGPRCFVLDVWIRDFGAEVRGRALWSLDRVPVGEGRQREGQEERLTENQARPTARSPSACGLPGSYPPRRNRPFPPAYPFADLDLCLPLLPAPPSAALHILRTTGTSRASTRLGCTIQQKFQ